MLLVLVDGVLSLELRETPQQKVSALRFAAVADEELLKGDQHRLVVHQASHQTGRPCSG